MNVQYFHIQSLLFFMSAPCVCVRAREREREIVMYEIDTL